MSESTTVGELIDSLHEHDQNAEIVSIMPVPADAPSDLMPPGLTVRVTLAAQRDGARHDMIIVLKS